ncbi:MAG: cation:proton antiporter [Polyangiaceae bacterium]|jgi:Kef-type K+ transport system membrane component KefB|nr:cation:proton antiporter [Polyangiaceae bacterium]
MSLTILLVLVVIFSFAVGHLLTRYASRYVALSGAEYLLVGVLIGPQVASRLMTTESLSRLEPLIALLLGLVGFVVALHTRDAVRNMRHAIIGFVSAFGVLLTVGAVTAVLVSRLIPVAPGSLAISRELFRIGRWAIDVHVATDHLWVAVAVGAAACVASPFVIESSAKMLGARGPVTDVLQSASLTSQVVAVLALGFAEAMARATDAANRFGVGVGKWAVAAAGIGIVCGLLFSLFIGREKDATHIFLASVGAVIFASGVGSAIGISPLFVNLVAGVTVAITSPHAGRLRQELDRLQHPLFVLLMIFAGALWQPASGWVWTLPLVYLTTRFVARRVWTQAMAALLFPTPLRAARLGNGLLAQGTMAVAVGVDFSQRFPDYAPAVLTTVLCGTLVSDLWSARALRAVLLDAGETHVESHLPSSRPLWRATS